MDFRVSKVPDASWALQCQSSSNICPLHWFLTVILVFYPCWDQLVHIGDNTLFFPQCTLHWISVISQYCDITCAFYFIYYVFNAGFLWAQLITFHSHHDCMILHSLWPSCSLLVTRVLCWGIGFLPEASVVPPAAMADVLFCCVSLLLSRIIMWGNF